MKEINMIKGDENQMHAVINMCKCREAKINSYTIKDLILDPRKKKEFDDFYSSRYEYVEKDDFAKKVFGTNHAKKE